MESKLREDLEKQFGAIDNELFNLALVSAKEHIQGNSYYMKNRSEIDIYREKLHCMRMVVVIMQRPL